MKGYTIKGNGSGFYQLVNPAGVSIAFGMSWRVARKTCDLYNADRRAAIVDRYPFGCTERLGDTFCGKPTDTRDPRSDSEHWDGSALCAKHLALLQQVQS